MKIATILVALDATERAPYVFQVAAELAERFDATLHLFRSTDLEPHFPPAAASGNARDSLPGHLVSQAVADLTALAGTHPRVAHPPMAAVGPPVQAILAEAARVGADLIVVGSHLHDVLDRLLGTTTGRLVHQSRHHVFVVYCSRPGESPTGAKDSTAR